MDKLKKWITYKNKSTYKKYKVVVDDSYAVLYGWLIL